MNEEEEMANLAFDDLEVLGERLYVACERYCRAFHGYRLPTGDTVGSAAVQVYEMASRYREAQRLWEERFPEGGKL